MGSKLHGLLRRTYRALLSIPDLRPARSDYLNLEKELRVIGFSGKVIHTSSYIAVLNGFNQRRMTQQRVIAQREITLTVRSKKRVSNAEGHLQRYILVQRTDVAKVLFLWHIVRRRMLIFLSHRPK